MAAPACIYVKKSAAQEVEDLASPVDESTLNESDSDNDAAPEFA